MRTAYSHPEHDPDRTLAPKAPKKIFSGDLEGEEGGGVLDPRGGPPPYNFFFLMRPGP